MKILFLSLSLLALSINSCSSQEQCDEPNEKSGCVTKEKKEPHRYGGWYCPDNFGFVPVNIAELEDVPAISNALPTKEELRAHKSLIDVDTEKYPDAKALEMDLPRVAKIYSEQKGIDELIIVIQAIIVEGDTVVGYRFPNGGNGSAWFDEVAFLSDEEVKAYGSQPFYYSKTLIKASKEDIWKAASNTAFFKSLGVKFNKKDFFTSEWTEESRAHLELNNENEYGVGYIGTVFGNAYLHIDYVKNGSHYSEKLLMIENQEEGTTELFFASGPHPENYLSEKLKLDNWISSIKQNSEVF